MRKPRIFIGSSSEEREIVDALESELREVATIERWDVGAFRPGHFTLEELTKAVEEAEFAIFVLGRDDVTESRGSTVPSPRDNVIFEAGLFTAILGRERTFYVVDKEGTKIPSDWAGLGYTTFDKTEARSRDKVYDAVQAIRAQVATWKPPNNLGPVTSIVGQWWQFVINVEVGAVLSLMEIMATEERVPRLHGTAWSTDGTRVASYRSQSARYEAINRTLYYSWEGEHPREQNVPRYFGVGEAIFHPSAGEAASRGEGWFSTSRSSDVTDALAKSAVYVRASPEEVATMKGTDREGRAALVQAKLADLNLIDA